MPSLVEISPVVLKKKNIKISLMFFAFLLISPLEIGRVLHLNIPESTSPKDALCKIWSKFEIGQVVLERKIF